MKSLQARISLSIRKDIAVRNRERLEELLSFVEEALDTERKRIEAYADKKLSEVKDEYDAMQLAESYSEDIFHVETDLPRLLRYALFVSLMSMTEENITGLCRSSYRLFNLTEEFKIGLPSVISRGVKYLVKNIGINTSNFENYLILSSNLTDIRNCIVHDQGSIKNRKGGNNIKTFITSISTINLDRHEKIVLNKGFVEYCSKEMFTFFNLLSGTIGKKYWADQKMP
jgi:hypothetical protein